MSDYVFVLAVSNCNYMIFNFLNLNAGWIHRVDNPRVPRPFKAPKPLFILGVAFAYLNAFLLGAGANAWGQGTLITGWVCALIAVPVFYYRHKVTDKGRFPAHMFVDLVPAGDHELGPKRAGILPYVAIAGGLAVMMLGESAGMNRHGEGDESSLRRRSSDPRWPRVMRRPSARAAAKR
jgi:hypothetical protein